MLLKAARNKLEVKQEEDERLKTPTRQNKQLPMLNLKRSTDHSRYKNRVESQYSKPIHLNEFNSSMSQNFKANSNVTQKIQEGKRNVKAQHNSMSHKKEGFKRLQISTRLN